MHLTWIHYFFQDPYINQSAPKVDEHYSLLRTHALFRTLGLRHLIVIDLYNRVVGIITRKDIMQFSVIERIIRYATDFKFRHLKSKEIENCLKLNLVRNQ